ncbi:unknown similar to AMEV090 [Mythimna separata entomopoxvirus 'L']|uniref:Uncharacterized protein n=1 Tax=Mythimna separata entomopoxvirus 'L' TaxID=1293572 RepID=A0A916KQ62_9POXV|nr:unknown similar to AMEV090 [Mythimna separata entomopoxvirus 'L']CCU56311.1 unknown similar to AMEV090 [Mythimna separata entomopoxvirus 'L']
MDIVVYDNEHFIEPISQRKDIYIDFVTSHIDKDIDCSSIKEKDNVYDVMKYFVFKSYNYNNIHIIYDVLYEKILVLKYNKNIKEYIIINKYLIILLENNLNLIIDICEKKYRKIIKNWFPLLLNADDILMYITYLSTNDKIIKPIQKNNIILDNNVIDKNKLIEIKSKNSYIICPIIINKPLITVPEVNKNILIINDGINGNKIYKLDYNILDMFNFSLIHILLITDIDHGKLILLNTETMEEEEHENCYSIINTINDKFYNKIRNSFLI